MLTFYKAFCEAIKFSPTQYNPGLHSYYTTEYGKTEGERLYAQHLTNARKASN